MRQEQHVVMTAVCSLQRAASDVLPREGVHAGGRVVADVLRRGQTRRLWVTVQADHRLLAALSVTVRQLDTRWCWGEGQWQ